MKTLFIGLRIGKVRIGKVGTIHPEHYYITMSQLGNSRKSFKFFTLLFLFFIFIKMEVSKERSYKNIDIEPFYASSSNATISSDGKLQATAVAQDVIVIDRSNNKIVHSIQGDGGDITTLRMTPDGTKLAIATSRDSTAHQLKVFDLATGEFIKSFKLTAASFISACDKTSSLFAFGLTDGSIIVWDVEKLFITHSLKGHGTTLSALTFYGDFNSKDWKLASGDIMGMVKVWDLVKRKAIFTSKEHASTVRGVNFNSDGTKFVTAGRDNLVMIYDPNNKYKEIQSIPLTFSMESVGFVHYQDKEYLFTAGEGCILKLWDVENEQLFAQTTPPMETSEELSITDVIQLEDDELIIVLSDQTLIDLDLLSISNGSIPMGRKMAGNHGTIADIRYVGPEKKLLALATNSPSLRVVDIYNAPLDMEIYEGHTDILNMLDSTIDGMWLATASKDKTARLWRWEQDVGFKCFAIFEGHVGSVTSIALPRTPIDGYPKFLITGSEDLTIKKWTVPKPHISGDVQIVKSSDYTRRAHDKFIHAIDVSPNNDFLATASHDKTSKIWDLQAGEALGVLEGHKRGVYDIKFCAYDRLIVTGSGDRTVRVWNLEDQKCIRSFEGMSNSVQRVSFLTKNQYIVGVAADGLIKIWEVSTGECVNTLDNHDNRIWALGVKNDGEEFITADADGAITIWQDNTDETRAEADARRKVLVEKEQDLQNCIRKGNWVKAFLLALDLDHPMRLYNVVKECIAKGDDPKSIIGSFELEALIGKLEDEKILLLLKRIRDWNTNGKLFEVAQKLIRVILNQCDLDHLCEIKGAMTYIDGIVPYSERHFQRFDDLVEQSFILDYVTRKMDELVN